MINWKQEKASESGKTKDRIERAKLENELHDIQRLVNRIPPDAYILYYSETSLKNPLLFLSNKIGGITHGIADFALAIKIY